MADLEEKIVDAEDDYASSEDEDFNPTTADVEDEDVSSSSDEEETKDISTKPRKATKKRKQADDGDLDSGDEATIKELRRKKKRKGEVDEDSGGEGGLIKTRAQRAAEKQERQEFKKANKDGVTVDVDALWARLISAPVGRSQTAKIQVLDTIAEQDGQANGAKADSNTDGKTSTQSVQEDEFITITQTYEFAGQTVSQEKRVRRDSAEAKLYLSANDPSKQKKIILQTGANGVALRRPLKRASQFEPNPTGEVKGLPLHLQRLRTPSRADVLAMQKRLEQEAEEKKAKAQRLNTVQKSAIDWAAHVDKEGLQDELTEYGRSKKGYMAKQDFLQNVAGRRDQEERRARLQGV